jgi:hypothetical protein
MVSGTGVSPWLVVKAVEPEGSEAPATTKVGAERISGKRSKPGRTI